MKYQLQLFKNGKLILESLFFNDIETLTNWAKQDMMTKVCTHQGDYPLIMQINNNNEQQIFGELEI